MQYQLEDIYQYNDEIKDGDFNLKLINLKDDDSIYESSSAGRIYKDLKS